MRTGVTPLDVQFAGWPVRKVSAPAVGTLRLENGASRLAGQQQRRNLSEDIVVPCLSGLPCLACAYGDCLALTYRVGNYAREDSMLLRLVKMHFHGLLMGLLDSPVKT
jgi:hypothetical protein